jgi:hypothetical protein
VPDGCIKRQDREHSFSHHVAASSILKICSHPMVKPCGVVFLCGTLTSISSVWLLSITYTRPIVRIKPLTSVWWFSGLAAEPNPTMVVQASVRGDIGTAVTRYLLNLSRFGLPTSKLYRPATSFLWPWSTLGSQGPHHQQSAF